MILGEKNPRSPDCSRTVDFPMTSSDTRALIGEEGNFGTRGGGQGLAGLKFGALGFFPSSSE